MIKLAEFLVTISLPEPDGPLTDAELDDKLAALADSEITPAVIERLVRTCTDSHPDLADVEVQVKPQEKLFDEIRTRGTESSGIVQE